MQHRETVGKENCEFRGANKSARLVLGEGRGWLVNITLEQVVAVPSWGNFSPIGQMDQDT